MVARFNVIKELRQSGTNQASSYQIPELNRQIVGIMLPFSGSAAAFCQPTDVANSVGVVRERCWLTFAPGEIRSCTSCHGINQTSQAGTLTPTNTPQALISLLNYWKGNASL